MKTTMVIDDDLYRQAKVVAAQRGKPVASVVEEALRLLLIRTAIEPTALDFELPSWDLGESLVDINDSRALREVLDQDLDLNAMR